MSTAMRISSVNVSEVTAVEHQGRRVTSGIYKLPVRGPVEVAPLNLAGDRQADLVNHGGEHKAVYAFGAQHYPHWSEFLGRDDLSPGFFGENLTVDVLDENLLHVGDQLTIGGVILQITQPRVPCFKLGMKAEHSRMPREFVQYGYTGAYLRVLQTGTIESGDAISVAPAGISRSSLAELFAAVHDPAAPDRRERMREALENPALSVEWQDLIAKRLERIA